MRGRKFQPQPPDMRAWHAVTYYSAIIAWAAYFVGASFRWPLPWAAEDCGLDQMCAADPRRALPLPSSNTYFTDVVLNENPDSLQNGVARIISGPLVGCTPPPPLLLTHPNHFHRPPHQP